METRRLTLVFTDLEGSTKLLERLQDAYPALLASHRELVRSAATVTGGEEVDCRGDGFFLTFEDPGAAARFAVRAQRTHARASWPGGQEVRVRMGVHTGEALLGGEGYVGLDVHRAARIGAAAHGGQVLLSREAAEGAKGVDSRQLGEFRLAGLTEPQCLFQLVAPGLRETFPPPRGVTLANRRRILVADDSVLLREGLVLLVEQAGWDVVGQAADADELLAQVEALRPDVVIADIRMPPTHTDDGLRAAMEIRRRYPAVAVLVLSQYAEPAYARELLAGGEEGAGYLLKDRIADVEGLAAALENLAEGGCVLDPTLGGAFGA
jgi:class 3 adenylate cyclase/CheY-like chemotaxis protein